MQAIRRLVLAIGLLALPLPSHAALKVVATTQDLAAIAQAVGGNRVEAISLTPGTRDPHYAEAKPGMIRQVHQADLLLLVGHDRNRPLARQSAGNLRVRDTASGLEFEADLVDTTDGRDTWALLSAGVVKGCSFAFVPDPFGERWFSKDGEEWCEISRVKELRELTLTADPCYPQTSAEARSSQALEAIRHKLRVQERSAYGPDSEYSWFRDLVTVREAARLTERLERQGVRRHVPGHLIEQGIPDRVHGGLEQARKRLASVQQRDVGRCPMRRHRLHVEAGMNGDRPDVLQRRLPVRAILDDLVVRAPRHAMRRGQHQFRCDQRAGAKIAARADDGNDRAGHAFGRRRAAAHDGMGGTG